MSLPLVQADRVASGHEVPFWRHWFEHSIGNDQFWDAIDHRHRLSATTPPVHFISGWYDFMLDPLLADYARLVELGHTPYLTIGTWFHVADELQRDNLRETILWMRAKLEGDSTGLRARPVRIHISGIDEWREFDRYPPGPPSLQTWFVDTGARLVTAPPSPADPDRYRYDPADPTPNLGGAIFAFTGAGAVDNAPLEARPDVLVYTSEPLAETLTVIGQTGVTLHARATIPHADFFVRLCDVSPAGISTNICDGLFRVTPETPQAADGSWQLEFTLHATAHAFLAGHCLRLQVSSGAHPRYARNLGTDEPIGTATTMVANDIEILHGPRQETAITLPLYTL
jgi:putative CocE/NonD family hydrolase